MIWSDTIVISNFFPSCLNIFATVFNKMLFALKACAQGYSKEMSSRMVLLAVYIELQSGEYFLVKNTNELFFGWR